MFRRRGVLEESAEGLLTQKALRYVRDIGPITWWDSGRQVVGAFTAPSMQELEGLAEQIFLMAQSGMAAAFPAHEHVNAYAALDLEARLTWPQRRELVHALAVHEGLPKEDLWLLRESECDRIASFFGVCVCNHSRYSRLGGNF